MLSLRKLGFTMIELLIVIAVLGILAVAVLAAINPIEQINRGRDTGSRSDAEQLLSAIDRFYASQGYYPWQFAADDTAHEPLAWTEAPLVTDVIDVSVPGDTAELMLEKLSTGGTSEIKTSFVTRISDSGYNSLHVFNNGDQGDSTYICFLPKSGSFAEEATLRCGTPSGGIYTSLPADLQPVGDEVCGGADGPMICLP